MADENTTDNSAGPVETPANAGKTFTEADFESAVEREAQKRINAAVTERLNRERKNAAEQAERQRLIDQQEFKALADSAEARVKELEPEAAQAARYRDALTAHLDVAMKDVPKAVRELLRDRDPVDALNWLHEHKDELVKQKPAPDVNARARSAVPSQEEQVEGTRAELRRTGMYGSM